MEIKHPFSGELISLGDQQDALRELYPKERHYLVEREEIESEADKLKHAMSLFQIFAQEMAKELNMKTHVVAFSLQGVLRHWDRR